MANKPWYKENPARLLVDMHIPDWDEAFLKEFSAEKYAEMMKLAGINAAEIYGSSCLGLSTWPTKVGYPHRNVGSKDLLGNTMKECRKAGMNTVLYFNVWCRKVYDEHPEWRMILAGNEEVLSDSGRFGICCPNTGYREYFLDFAEECNAHAPDAVASWIDMIGPLDYMCYCPACQKRFKEETGRDRLPEIVDWSDPAWREFQEFRARTLADFAQDVRDRIQQKFPGRGVVFNSASMVVFQWAGAYSEKFIRANDFLAGDFPGDAEKTSTTSKFLNAMSPDHPIEFMSPRCEVLELHTSSLSEANLRMHAYAAVANHCSFTLIDAIDPAGTLREEFYHTAGRVNKAFLAYKEFIAPDSREMADAAIYCNFATSRDYRREPTYIRDYRDPAGEYNECMRNLVRIMQKGKLLSAFAAGMYPERVRTFPALILPDAAVLSEKEAEELRSFVFNGGKLIAFADTSLFDETTGKEREDFQLADVFGVHSLGKRSMQSCYYHFADGTELLQEKRPMTLVRADEDCEILAVLAEPWCEPSETVRFGAALSDPVRNITDIPALVRHKFGAGEVLYFAGNPAGMRHEFSDTVLSGVLRKFLAGEDDSNALVQSELAPAVEVTIREEESRYLVSLLNFTSEMPPPPRYDVVLSLKLAGVKSVRLAPGREELPFEEKGGRITVRLKKLDEFALLEVIKQS
ncbi:MAG: hypothetical protein IJZ19_10385 [Lentisphaeria bacterium]|nr:hypothetical protein [Lentisphaeria bacterium]